MNPNKRLLSLDVLRGITVAGMILVNNTGKCGYNFAAFAHAKWDGFSPADLVGVGNQQAGVFGLFA